MKIPQTPKGIKGVGKRFWKKVLSEYELIDAHDRERLKMACKCLDDLAEIEARVEADGRFTVNRYGSVVPHPGLKEIKDNRMLFTKIIREMGLDLATESRPPRQY